VTQKLLIKTRNKAIKRSNTESFHLAFNTVFAFLNFYVVVSGVIGMIPFFAFCSMAHSAFAMYFFKHYMDSKCFIQYLEQEIEGHGTG
jgi:hypothetical protein